MTADGLTPQQPRVFRIFSIGGTTVDIRPSFIILAGLFVLLDLDRQVPIPQAALWIPILFFSVLIHELAHAGVIGLFGHGASRIELGGWGGQTMNRRRAASWQEILISLAGPLSSIALAQVIVVVLTQLPVESTNPLLFEFLRLMVWANRAWGIFNLVPIIPLDGGQILLHGLAHVVKPQTAFVATTWLSILLSVALGVFALIFAKAYFVAIIAASLVMQNWQHWREWQRFRAARAADSESGEPPAQPPSHGF
ncbi:MAG: M50 family metallopeptidase [Thermoanaerobaculia bacterium]